MPDHIPIGVVADNQVIGAAGNRIHQMIGYLRRAHGGLQIISGYRGRGHQHPLFPRVSLLPAAIEKESNVSVLLGFGYAQLGSTKASQILGQAIGQVFRGEGAAGGKAGGVLRGHHEIGQLNRFAALELLELRLNKAAGELPGPVGAEIHEQYAISVIDRNRRLAGRVHGAGLYEFIILAAGVGLRQRGAGRCRREPGLAFGQQTVGGFDTRPAIVPIHGVVTSADRGHSPAIELFKQFLYRQQRSFGAAGRCVSPIEKGVQVNPPGAAGVSQFNGRVDVPLVAVYATGGQQPEDMNGAVAVHRPVQRPAVGRVAMKTAVADRLVDAGHTLVDHPTRPQAHVPDFGIAHLPGGQTHIKARSGNQRVRTLPPPAVPNRGVGVGNCVSVGRLAVTPSIEDNQKQGAAPVVAHRCWPILAVRESPEVYPVIPSGSPPIELCRVNRFGAGQFSLRTALEIGIHCPDMGCNGEGAATYCWKPKPQAAKITMWPPAQATRPPVGAQR